MTTEGAIHPSEKISYRPIDIAIRWCGLIEQEQEILALETQGTGGLPQAFSPWPCVPQKLEILWSAIRKGEVFSLPLDAPANSAQPDPLSSTILHIDLKYWFIQHRPFDRPEFLFNETERRAPLSVSQDFFHELLLMFDASIGQLRDEQLRIAKLNAEKAKLHSERRKLLQDNTALRIQNRNLSTPNEHSEAAYLQLIGELVKLILGHSPSGQPYSTFRSQASIIDKLIAYNPGRLGFAQRRLEQRFAAANRRLAEVADLPRKSR
jgi:hypothetical protein